MSKRESPIISNPDGETGFIALSLNDLFLNDCIIAEGMKP